MVARGVDIAAGVTVICDIGVRVGVEGGSGARTGGGVGVGVGDPEAGGSRAAG